MDTVLVTTATITISNIFCLSQGSSHNNIVKLQSDNFRDKKIIFLVLDHLKRPAKEVNFLSKNKMIFGIFHFKIALKIMRLIRKVISSCFAAYGIIFLATKSNNLIFSSSCYVSVC